MSKPLILVTNDDGIESNGIKALIEVAKKYGEVIVIAPDSPQSGQGHAITLTSPIKLRRRELFDGIEAMECSGTPVDCVKLAKNVILKDRKIDLCVSGINHGSNASLNIIYSGTMSAAMEASIEGINAIGFSLEDYSKNADFTAAKHYADILIKELLAYTGKGKLLNVNIPKLPLEQIKGSKVCIQGEGGWVEDFKESEDPRGEKYYWLGGSFKEEERNPETDLYALGKGYVSIVPSHHDLTDYKSMKEFKHLESLT
jgi:5'-nucleotidase